MNDSKKNSDCQSTIPFAVYVIWCMPTEKFYVGVTHNKVEERIRQHKKGKDQFIDKEIQRIGWEDNWDYWVVEENIPYNLITEREQKWISFFDSVFPKGYNKTIGGIKFFKHTKETCKKMSKSHTGKKCAPFTAEHRANIAKSRTGEKNPNFGKPAWNRGITCPEETKQKISETLTGRERPDQSERMKGENNPNFGKPLSPETKAKLREKALERDVSGENNPMYGKHHTDETRAQISEAHKRENLSDETIAKMSAAQKGKKASPETKAKLSAAKKGEKNHFYGKHHSEETKAKLREKALARAAAKKAAKLAAENSNENSAQDKTS